MRYAAPRQIDSVSTMQTAVRITLLTRYRPSPARRFGTGLLRRSVAVVLRRPFGDATSGLYAVNAKALPLLAEPFAPPWGGCRFFCSDPDGYLVEIEEVA